MSILINGMKMPKNHSYITITIWPNGIASYGLFDREEHLCDFQNTKAIPVPPHGRLVDADRLLSERMKQAYYHLPNGDTAIPIIDIEHAPTIIPAEEPKEEC